MEDRLIKVSCVGDSITAGYGLDEWEDSYPNQLYYLLGERYVVNPNLGKNGAAIWRHSLLPYKNTREYNEAIQWTTDILVVCLGANDTIYQTNDSFCKEFKADYEELLSDLMKCNSDAKVYLCMIPPMFGTSNAPFAAKVPLINAMIAEVAESCGASLIDINSVLASKPELFSDGLHPNETGARIIAETVCGTIKRDLL